MKTRIIITGILLCGCTYLLKAQHTVTRDMLYKTSIRIVSDPSFACYGALYEVSDSSISISSRRIKDYYSGNIETLKFPVEDLKVIYTNKPGNGGRGAKIGAISGAAIGMLFGAAITNGTILPAWANMAIFGTCGLAIGTPTGFIIGKIAGHERTVINGSMDEFNQNKNKLKNYAIKK